MRSRTNALYQKGEHALDLAVRWNVPAETAAALARAMRQARVFALLCGTQIRPASPLCKRLPKDLVRMLGKYVV